VGGAFSGPVNACEKIGEVCGQVLISVLNFGTAGGSQSDRWLKFLLPAIEGIRVEGFPDGPANEFFEVQVDPFGHLEDLGRFFFLLQTLEKLLQGLSSICGHELHRRLVEVLREGSGRSCGCRHAERLLEGPAIGDGDPHLVGKSAFRVFEFGQDDVIASIRGLNLHQKLSYAELTELPQSRELTTRGIQRLFIREVPCRAQWILELGVLDEHDVAQEPFGLLDRG